MLHHQGIHNGWLLDPIGNQPLSAIELAQAGYRVFVACNNPILARLLEVICAAYPLSEYQAAIADLGALKRGEERVETQIKRLYLSSCPECFSTNTDVRYLWKRNHKVPFAREIVCKNCDTTGIFKLSEADEKQLQEIGNIQLHRTRMLQRVYPGSVEPPIAVKEVVDSYLPRSIAVISSLVNKLESLNTTPERASIIEALLIHVFDYGNMLWGISSGRNRPKLITIPNEFYEFNLWDVIERAVLKLHQSDKPIPFYYYPELPPDTGGICFYPDRFHSLSKKVIFPDFSAITTVLPRPNQALWTYNAVWSGWLWGQQAAQKLKGALERRRYDWIWHSQAIKKIFDNTSTFDIPFLAIAPELTNSYILAYLSAASASGYTLTEAAYHYEQKSGQFYWLRGNFEPKNGFSTQYNQNIKRYLELKSEPADYQELLSIFLIAETIDKSAAFTFKSFDTNLFIQAQTLFEKTLKDQSQFRQVDDDQLENAEFWLSQEPARYQPYSDQVEGSFIRFIQKNPEFSFEEVAYKINLTQPGMLPISQILLQRLLNSYCELMPDEKKWKLNYYETISERKNDISQMKILVKSIGEKLGFSVSGENPMEWFSDAQKPNYQFFITASSIISQFMEKADRENFETVIIFPGSRSELISYKLKYDPIYNHHFGKYHYVKYRHLRTIHENPVLDIKTWALILDSDPAVWQESIQPGLF
jgi:hypothetical protein